MSPGSNPRASPPNSPAALATRPPIPATEPVASGSAAAIHRGPLLAPVRAALSQGRPAPGRQTGPDRVRLWSGPAPRRFPDGEAPGSNAPAVGSRSPESDAAPTPRDCAQTAAGSSQGPPRTPPAPPGVESRSRPAQRLRSTDSRESSPGQATPHQPHQVPTPGPREPSTEVAATTRALARVALEGQRVRRPEQAQGSDERAASEEGTT